MGQAAPMHLFGDAVSGGSGFFLILAVALALAFECVNGFHDTANAVATVIYTHTLRPWIAVVWSGMWNLIGVLMSSGAVAYGVVALLPVETGAQRRLGGRVRDGVRAVDLGHHLEPGHVVHGVAREFVAFAHRRHRRGGSGEQPDGAGPPLRRGRQLVQSGRNVHGVACLARDRVRVRGGVAVVTEGDGQAAGAFRSARRGEAAPRRGCAGCSS